MGCEGIFGPINVVAEMADADAKELQVGCLNVLAAPADIHWAKLGIKKSILHGNFPNENQDGEHNSEHNSQHGSTSRYG